MRSLLPSRALLQAWRWDFARVAFMALLGVVGLLHLRPGWTPELGGAELLAAAWAYFALVRPRQSKPEEWITRGGEQYRITKRSRAGQGEFISFSTESQAQRAMSWHGRWATARVLVLVFPAVWLFGFWAVNGLGWYETERWHEDPKEWRDTIYNMEIVLEIALGWFIPLHAASVYGSTLRERNDLGLNLDPVTPTQPAPPRDQKVHSDTGAETISERRR